MIARDIMTTTLITISPDCSIGETVRRFRDARLQACPVVDPAGKFLGIVTIWQVLSRALPSYILSGDLADVRFAPDLGQFHERLTNLRDQPVDAILERNPPIVRPSDSVLECAAKFLSTPKAVHLLPVVDETNRLLGVVAPMDVIKEIL